MPFFPFFSFSSLSFVCLAKHCSILGAENNYLLRQSPMCALLQLQIDVTPAEGAIFAALKLSLSQPPVFGTNRAFAATSLKLRQRWPAIQITREDGREEYELAPCEYLSPTLTERFDVADMRVCVIAI